MADQGYKTKVLVSLIKGALGTDENDDGLIEVARNAHKAEQELATWKSKFDALGLTIEDAYKRLLGVVW